MATLELFDAVVDIVNGNGRNTDQTISIGTAIIDQPVVVNAEAGFLQAGIIESEEIEHQCRIEHFGAQAVGFHFLHPGVRIPTAGVLLKAFADLMRRKQRCGFAVFFRHAFLPKIHRLHDMGIR